jgi:transketolase
LTDTVALARTVRRYALEMTHRAKASHIASALSIADIVSVLYGQVLTFDVKNPQLDQRDRFILSKGHACVAVYAALAARGFFDPQLLHSYGKDHSIFMNHISHKVPGVEFSTGALGHGLSFGVGKALAAKHKKAAWRVFVVLSDGEMDEGSNWEAMLFAAHHQLNNITVLIDYNKLQSLDTIDNTLRLEPLLKKLESFGWMGIEVDGHDHAQLLMACNAISTTRPKAIICHTTKGKGVSFMENKVAWHYQSPSADQLEQAILELEAHA